MEHRKISQSKPSPLPLDYLKMVTEVFTTNFDAGLKVYSQYRAEPYFEAQGEIASGEIVLAVSLMNKNQLSATTVYASSDFDPKASSPTVQDILEACIDAAGTLFGTLLAPEKPEKIALLADESLSSLENIPFLWTEFESNKKRIFIKLDKSNLTLDNLTDKWLKENDPKLKDQEAEEERETENLFFTGPKPGGKSGTGSGHIH